MAVDEKSLFLVTTAMLVKKEKKMF